MRVNIGDQSSWHFVNGTWGPDAEGIFRPAGDALSDDGRGIQGYHFAFCKAHTFADLRATFQFRHNAGHSDAGFIFRAADPQHFYLLHFPDCGQASRAQNFWVALSRMEPSGVLSLVKLELVRRVASCPRGQWHDADVRATAERLLVRIDGRGLFEVNDPQLAGAGRVGIMSFSDAQIRDLSVEGDPIAADAWSEKDHRVAQWFHPCPTSEKVWQRPASVVRHENGDLLLLYTSSIGTGWAAEKKTILVRSGDNGRSWKDPCVIADQKDPCFLHRFPDGQVKLVSYKDRLLSWRTSSDAGRTWSAPTSGAEIGPMPSMNTTLNVGPQALLNLRDGAMLMMLYGKSVFSQEGMPVQAWGGIHCHAHSCRSEDGGKTWSPPIPIDNVGNDGEGKPIPPNHDLTEVCCAEVEEGRILALIRPIYSPWVWETWSRDGGRSWGPCLRGPFPGYATPNMLRTRSGCILVAHRLPGLTVHCSRDNGMTFDQGTMIDSALWAMGSMIEVEPDVALYVYWDSFYGLMRGQFLRVTDSRLVPERRWGATPE